MAVDAVHRHYQAARYATALDQLPDLLATVDALARTDLDPAAAELYVDGYIAAAKLMTKLGHVDLALIAADRAAATAVQIDRPESRGLAAYQVACALLRAGRRADADRVATTTADRLATPASTPTATATLLSAAGALWLLAAIIAARRGDRGDAWSHLQRANRLAGRLDADANAGWTAFGPTNVAIHRVSVAVELGDAGEALRLAGAVNPDRMPAELLSRRAQIHLDLAWAQAHRRRDAEATLHLLEAERAAPEAARYNVRARELIREVLSRGTRRPVGPLTDLAVRAGVLA